MWLAYDAWRRPVSRCARAWVRPAGIFGGPVTIAAIEVSEKPPVSMDKCPPARS